VFSESKKQFLPGTVTQVSDEDDGRWLTVYYGSRRQREIQRFIDQIRIPKKHKRKSKNRPSKSNIERVLSRESKHRKSTHNLHIQSHQDQDTGVDVDTTLNKKSQPKASKVKDGTQSGQQEEEQERDEIKVSNQEQKRPILFDPKAFPESTAGVNIDVGDWMDMVKAEWAKGQALLNQQQSESNRHIQELEARIEHKNIEIKHLNTCNDKLAVGMKDVLDMLSDDPCLTRSVRQDDNKCDVQKADAQDRVEQIEEINTFIKQIKDTLVRQKDTMDAQQDEIRKLLLCRHTTSQIFKKLITINRPA